MDGNRFWIRGIRRREVSRRRGSFLRRAAVAPRILAAVALLVVLSAVCWSARADTPVTMRTAIQATRTPDSARASVPAAGIPTPPPHGDPLDAQRAQAWGVSLCVIGCLLTMGLYHAALFALRGQSAYLYFSLVCFMWAGFFVTGDFTQWVIRIFAPRADPLLLYQFHMSFFLMSRTFGHRFLRALYPQEVPKFFRHVGDAIPLIFGPVLWVAPSFYAVRILILVHLVTGGTLFYAIWRLVVCVRRRRDGARFILCGFVVATLLGVYRMLSRDGVLAPLLPAPSAGALVMLGIVSYVLSEAMALVQLYAKSFARVRDLFNTLRENNHILHREAETRNRLERKIVSVSEEERRRISRELHDGLCQNLTAARLYCATLEERTRPDAGGEQLTRLGELLDEAAKEAYGMSRGLWPVEHGADAPGLSLEALVRHLTRTCGVKVELQQELRCAACTNPNAVPVCRIAQEAVVNAIKHARAERITVRLSCREPGGLRLEVSDDGVGRKAATSSHGGLGLEIMAHRAKVMNAAFEISDAPGGGTTVCCVAPCHEAPSRTTRNA